MKKKIIWVLLLAAVLLSACTGQAPGETLSPETALTVNGEPVSYEEFAYFIRQQRPLCYAYFSGTCGVPPEQLQWDQAYDGITPAQWSADQALLALLQSHGIFSCPQNALPGTDFQKIFRQWQQQAEQGSQSQYGPSSMEFSAYFDYVLSQYRAAVQKELLRREPDPEALLEKLYEESTESFWARQVPVLRCSVPGNPESVSQLQELRERAQGLTLEQLTRLASEYPLVLVRQEQLSEADRALNCENLLIAALPLSSGEVTPLTQNRTTVDFALLLHDPERIRLPFEAVRPAIESVCSQSLLQNYLSAYCAEAEVTFTEHPAKIAQQVLSGGD